MHYLNEYYKSHTYESVTLEETRLNFLKHSLCAPQLCAEFLERIVRTIRGFTVHIISMQTLTRWCFLTVHTDSRNDTTDFDFRTEK